MKYIYFDNVKYVGEKIGFDKLPFGYINKQICGCGATSIAIENKDDTIILVPNLELIDNKIVQYPNERCNNELFGVKSGKTKKQIHEYIERMKLQMKPFKLMVCYDSLDKVIDYLNICKAIVVDESQEILKMATIKADSRKKVTDKDCYSYMMDTLEQYKCKVSFISATPIPLEYMPKWVQELEQIKFCFNNVSKANPFLIKVRYPYKYLEDEIIRPLKQNGSFTINDDLGNSYSFKKVIVFMNSVRNIYDIAKNCNLKIEDIGYICSDNIRNDSKLKQYKRLENPRELPKFTFITSTGFKGIDLYDDEAINIIVSNTSKKY